METYYGKVQSPADAIKLFDACRLGLLPRVQRRLSEKERQCIRSGSVFVWDEKEAGMRRWTDGKSWSASRVSGSFLTYREMEGKRGNASGQGPKRTTGKTPDSPEEDLEDAEPDGYRYKPDGLLKQSFSITTKQGCHLHLISYFARGAASNDLPIPSNDPQLRSVHPPPGMYPESSIQDNQIPLSAKEPMQRPPHYGNYSHHGQPSRNVHPGHHPGQQGQQGHPGHPGHHPHQGHPHPGHPPYPGHPPHPAHQPYSSHHQPSYPGTGWSSSHEGPPSYGPSYNGAQPPLPPLQHQYPPLGPPTHQQPPYATHQQPPYDMRRPPQFDRRLPLPELSGHPGSRPIGETLAPLRGPHTPPEHQPALPPPPPPLARSPHMDQPPRIPPIDSPRSQQLQAQAREAAARISQQGPLPGLTIAPPPSTYPHGAASTQTPPTRALSVSPRSAHSDAKPPTASTTASLSVLLHPTPANSEPSSASAAGSPAAMEASRPLPLRQHDDQVLGKLNKNF